MPTYSELSSLIAAQVDDAIVANAATLEEAIQTGLQGSMSREEMNSRMIINAMSVTARISIQSTLMILHAAGVIQFEDGLTPDLTLIEGGKQPDKEPD